MTAQGEAANLEQALADTSMKLIQAPVRWLDTHSESLVRSCVPVEPGYSYTPHDVGTEQKAKSVRFPAVELHHFENAIISPQSSSVFLGDRVVIERVEGVEPWKCDFSAGHLIGHDTSQCGLRIKGAVINVPRGIFVAGNGATNYYHLLIEILPRLQYVLNDPRFAGYPLLVDQSVDQIPNFRELVNVVSGGHPYLALPGHRTYRVGSLAYVSAPCTLPFNLRAGIDPQAEYYLTRPATIAFLRERFLQRFPESQAQLPKRVFLARKTRPRNYNQEEIAAVFAPHGFETIYLDDLSVGQQVQLMRQVDMIAGPTGAAWANMTFCREGTKAFCWMADTYADFACYSNLAKAVGVDLNYIRYNAQGICTRDLFFYNYRLEPDKVRSALKELWGFE